MYYGTYLCHMLKNFYLHNHACLGLYSGDTPTCAWNLTLASARLIEHQVGNSPVFGSAAFMQAAVCFIVLFLLDDGLAQVGYRFSPLPSRPPICHSFRDSFL
jgi:hypothetical protein